MSRYDRLSMYKTTVSQHNGFTCVVYHSTTIVAFDSDSIILRSGGWHSVTTKRKMNQASHQFGLGYAVYQRKGKWYVAFRTVYGFDWDNPIDFVDGMVIPRRPLQQVA